MIEYEGYDDVFGFERSLDAPAATILRTARLVLEPLAPGHLEALHAHWTEPGVRRYLWDGRTVSKEEVGEVIQGSAELFREPGAGLWALVPADAPELIGCGGFWPFHDPPELELVLSLSSAWWGRGLAREAASALLDHAFDTLGWEAVQASADVPNEASLALMRRLGMRPAGERPGEFGPIEVCRITKETWRREPRPPSSGRLAARTPAAEGS